MNIFKELVGPFVFVIAFSFSLTGTGLTQYDWQHQVKDAVQDPMTPRFDSSPPEFWGTDGYTDLITQINERLRQIPPDLTAYLDRANYYRDHGAYDEALSDYAKYIAAFPREYDGWYERGMAYQDMDKDRLAIADFDRAIKLDPGSDEAFWTRV